MNLAIVGADQGAWTKHDEIVTRNFIREFILSEQPENVISGACPKGGVDIWAVEEAKKLGVGTVEYVPKFNRWEPEGFKARNIKIAEACDQLVCFVKPGDKYCHHCGHSDHFPNGGCWTAKKAQQIGKKVYIIRVKRLSAASIR